MKFYKAYVTIRLRSSILDVQGKTIEHALQALRMPSLSNVRLGKHIELDVHAPDAETARTQVQDACNKLLANPVMEDYEITLTETTHQVPA
ncbi:MAG: phosphoribosylformylglycinamidine synthase subunit PurS [Chlorobi bacterium]|nr:MAG: phosphoribosylformylglycinamidine synthase subunit PurS [Bacteroidota bacterium]MBE2265319.1 phosphoribosylformylglycinamidine synthase subunit PurS [Flavobacteriales bacterium]MBL1160218.1 phosphoribosylformylglycinamidine synthase subunit PurS [Chlorobiota bacterium]MBW7853356.1 phosphoribosylformylglycinamidine synthase subunit PurS [Candidatus Kapabacteria bacterium]MCC6330403.1 phosphoribosylformylglycinamidine synthase subunit PurS [Ignavibacteria bacterium]